MKVVVLGASNKEDRYSYMALGLLKEKGHEVIPVHPVHDEILGLKVKASLNDVQGPVDTVSVYLNPSRGEPLLEDFIKLNPVRVILNPGAESASLQSALENKGVNVMQACTIVMLKTAQF